jgi:hypothetical protein
MSQYGLLSDLQSVLKVTHFFLVNFPFHLELSTRASMRARVGRVLKHQTIRGRIVLSGPSAAGQQGFIYSLKEGRRVEGICSCWQRSGTENAQCTSEV